MNHVRRALAVLSLFAALTGSRAARATDVQDFPDTGTEPLGRGGAWVARASSPLATFQNPAGLAGQKSGVLANVHLVFNEVCFQRQGDGAKIAVGGGLDYPEVCNENKGTPTPLPALAGVLRATERLGIGLMVAAPNVLGTLRFPETAEIRNNAGFMQALPSPQRYMLLEQDGIALNTTLGAGMEILPGLRVGAGFVWGFAKYKLANANMSLNPKPDPADGSYLDPSTSDVRAELNVADWFMPGATFGVLYSPLSTLDVGLNVMMQDAFDAQGDLTTKANYWTTNGTSDNPAVSDSADVEEGLGHFRLANPLEARLGVRFHLPRNADAKPAALRDPLVDDLFDVELDFSYTRNSAYDRATLRFPASPAVPVNGTPGVVPQNNDVDFKVKGDTIGLRLGGDYVILPGKLAARAGGFYEPNVQNDAYANVSFLASQRVGAAVGATYRVAMVDVELAYMHIFVSEIDNGDGGKLLVVSGDAKGGRFRSPYGINSGRFKQSVNVVSVGATARF